VLASGGELGQPVVAMYPDRFALLAMLPYGDDTAVAAELERLAGYPGWPGSA
jgi:predicted TIM-barrel fold metal-dependent hydrolase